LFQFQEEHLFGGLVAFVGTARPDIAERNGNLGAIFVIGAVAFIDLIERAAEFPGLAVISIGAD